jgi:hypothetical protein
MLFACEVADNPSPSILDGSWNGHRGWKMGWNEAEQQQRELPATSGCCAAVSLALTTTCKQSHLLQHKECCQNFPCTRLACSCGVENYIHMLWLSLNQDDVDKV